MLILSVLSIFIISFATTSVAARTDHEDPQGRVYIMTNSVNGNHVIAYDRASDGSLSLLGSFSTNGKGTGSGLGNQGGLALTNDGKWLLVVNAQSNDVSVFHANDKGLELTDRVGSNGVMPISVTVQDHLVYVLDTGGKPGIGNIAGYRLNGQGELSPISGSVQPLSGMTAPAQISFNPNGNILVVTEKTTNKIDTYTVNHDGVASPPTVQASSGSTPFGFGFTNKGTLIVSEAAGGPQGTSAVSSYGINRHGILTVLSGSVPDTQQAACWIVVTGNDRFVYTTNTHGNTISSYKVNSNGRITLLHAVATNTDMGPLDMALSNNSHFLYVFNSGSHTIQGFTVHGNGSLSWTTTVNNIPPGADGLAAN